MLKVGGAGGTPLFLLTKKENKSCKFYIMQQ